MKNQSCPVVHFEMPTENNKRTAKFYSEVFNWNMVETGEEMGHYLLANTTQSDEKTGRPTTPGAINGGFYMKSEKTSNKPSLVIAVPNIEEYMKKVVSSGGKILGEPVDIPTVGKFVSFVDTEGNQASMLQPSM